MTEELVTAYLEEDDVDSSDDDLVQIRRQERISSRVDDMHIQADAVERFNRERSADQLVPPFDAGMLADILARPPEPPHRVEGLIPSNGGTIVVAARKTGKTTFKLNLARALIDGGNFLGRFPVRPIAGLVGILNFEVSAAQLARWADQHGVPQDKLYLVNLRGRRNPLKHDADRDRLADQLIDHQVETLIVDPFGRAYTGISQNDPGEVGAWLADLDRWVRGDCGIADLILSVHAGWNAERTRGSSALEDWADSIINLVRDKDDDQIRYLRAEGRDVLVDEDRLHHDPDTRTLTLAGTGSRKAATKVRQVDELLPVCVAIVTATPGINGTGVEKQLREDGVIFQRGDERKALQRAVAHGSLEVVAGKRNAKDYYLTGTLPKLPQDAPVGNLGSLPNPPYIGGEAPRGSTHPDPPQETKPCPDCGTVDIPPTSAQCAPCARAIIDKARSS